MDFYHIKIKMQIMDLGAKNFGIRENIEAFPVGTRPLVPMK